MANVDSPEAQRVEAFSDGVFGVAITFLAIDLRPEIGGASSSPAGLANALAAAWPNYLSFALSFGSVLIMWINHHGIFKYVKRVTSLLLFSNGLLLMLTTVVPFATGLLARHMLEPASRVAAAVYAGLFLLINLSYNLLWAAISAQNSGAEQDNPLRHRLRTSYLIGLGGYAAALAVAYWSPFATIVICACLWLLWVTNVHPVHDRPRPPKGRI